MAKADYLSILYSKEMSPLEFNFETLAGPPISNWLSSYDIGSLYNIATSVRYAAMINKKKQAIDDIMTKRGCRKLAGGTNRICYAINEYNGMIIKVALDRVAQSDAFNEYKNQFMLKPFITKVFEYDPSGTVSSAERIQGITSEAEFMSIAEDIFEVLTNKIIGKYIIEDVGTKFFMNWGVRNGFGPALLDFPSLFELDGDKIFCNNRLPTNEFCGGMIDYDAGFNHLYCQKCGKKYQARQLQNDMNNNLIKITERADVSMVSQLIINGKVVRRGLKEEITIKQEKENVGVLRNKMVPMSQKEINKMNYENNKKKKESETNDLDPISRINKSIVESNNTKEQDYSNYPGLEPTDDNEVENPEDLY